MASEDYERLKRQQAENRRRLREEMEASRDNDEDAIRALRRFNQANKAADPKNVKKITVTGKGKPPKGKGTKPVKSKGCVLTLVAMAAPVAAVAVTVIHYL